MSINEYLTELWVVGKYGYSSLNEAKRYHPTGNPRRIIYQDKAWPIPVVYSDPVPSYRTKEPEESLRSILERCWESWRVKNGYSE
jgi:hypothetical protein